MKMHLDYFLNYLSVWLCYLLRIVLKINLKNVFSFHLFKNSQWESLFLIFKYSLPECEYSNQNSMAWHENRHLDQWDKTASPEINPCINAQVILCKSMENIYGKDNHF
jgi:hypothetical protein